MFRATTRYNNIESEDNTFIVPYTDEVETDNGWKYMKDVLLTDKINLDGEFYSILAMNRINEQGDYKLILEYND